MSYQPARLRKTARIGLITTALGMVMAAGAVSPAMAGGANGQCPGGPYCRTITSYSGPSLNGNGNGNAVGKQDAGAVGKADYKNPKGQKPNGSDLNAGYECDTNHGIGRSNPAHTGCQPPITPKVTPSVTPKVTPKVTPSVSISVTSASTTAPASVLGTSASTTASATTSASVLAANAQATHPLPVSAHAGLADTSGQLAVGGLAGLGAVLMLGSGFVLRRRHGVV